MTKDKPRVNFYGKDMSLPRARLFSLELELGLASIIMTQEDTEDYSKWRNIRENRNALSRKLIKEETYKKLSEKDYLVEILDNQIKYIKNEISDLKIKARNVKYCEKHGHTGREDSAYCAKCGVDYGKGQASNKIDNPFRG